MAIYQFLATFRYDCGHGGVVVNETVHVHADSLEQAREKLPATARALVQAEIDEPILSFEIEDS